ncbi:MAG TPA: Hsp20/alpha crystallin family protein [Polyangiaceae bacterium]
MNTNLQQQNDKNGTRNGEKTRMRELTPAVDVYENEAELLIVADLPGATREGLDIQIHLPELRFETKPAEPDGPVWRRSFTVDEHIDATKVSAELTNGVLVIHLPKADEIKPRKIAIRGAA